MFKRTNLSLHLLLLSIILLFFCIAADSSLKLIDLEGEWDNPGQGLTDKQMAWHKFSNFFENEHIYFMARLDEGYWFSFQVFNFKYGPQIRWGVYGFVIDDNGKTYFTKREILPNEPTVNFDKMAWRCGNTWVDTNQPNFTINVEEQAFGGRIEFKSKSKAWNFGKMFYTPDHKEYTHVMILAPWADVSGYLVLNGKKIPVHGKGYVDKTNGNYRLDRTDPLFYGLRAIYPMPGTEQISIEAACNYFHPAYGKLINPNLFIMRQDKIEVATRKVTFKGDKPKMLPEIGLPFPQRITIDAKDGDFTFHGVFEADRNIEAMDIFKQLPPYIRKVAELFFKRPVNSKWSGHFKGNYTKGGKETNFDILSVGEVNYIEQNESKK